MASSARSEMLREREEERRLNMRTLVIASFASAAAAAVTSQLWIRGTWIAAALTPALVALISEAMHRPADRLARARTTDRPALGAGASRHADEPAPADEPLPPRSEGTPRTAGAPRAAGAPGPVRVYRQPAPRAAGRAARRGIALGVVAATAAIAFVVAAVTLTAGDLASGGSIGNGGVDRSLFSSDSNKKQDSEQNAAPTQTSPEQTPSTEEPPPTSDTAPEPPPSDTAPATPVPESPPGEPAPDAVP